MVSVFNGALLCSTHRDGIVAMRGLCVDMAELLPTLASPYNSSNDLGWVCNILCSYHQWWNDTCCIVYGYSIGGIVYNLTQKMHL